MMGLVSVVTTHVTSTITFTSTAESTAMEQVRVRGVPAVRVEGGGVTDTPGEGTAVERNSFVVHTTIKVQSVDNLLSTTTVLVS